MTKRKKYIEKLVDELAQAKPFTNDKNYRVLLKSKLNELYNYAKEQKQ